jgi:hypothetical protein
MVTGVTRWAFAVLSTLLLAGLADAADTKPTPKKSIAKTTTETSDMGSCGVPSDAGPNIVDPIVPHHSFRTTSHDHVERSTKSSPTKPARSSNSNDQIDSDMVGMSEDGGMRSPNGTTH